MQRIESLEQRRLLTAELVGTDLLVAGTFGNDSFVITQGGGFVTVNDNGATTQWEVGTVQRVVMRLKSGDDLVNASQLRKGMWVATGIGSDVVVTGSGNDVVLSGTTGNKRIDTGIGNDRIEGGDGNDTLLGGEGTDTIRGGRGDDLVAGGDGNNSLFGDDGNDTLRGGVGRDLVVGGSGNDLTSYGAHPAGVSISIDNRANDGMSGENDNILDDVEAVATTAFGDEVTSGAQLLRVNAGPGDDYLASGGGPVVFFGGGGNDTMIGSTAADEFTGGSGLDTADYGGRSEDLVLRADGSYESGAAGEGDMIAADIETLVSGSGVDSLYGNDLDNWLFANDGNDYLSGGGGNDTLTGGWGNDTLEGGSGFDTVDYTGRSDPMVLRIGEPSGIVGELDAILTDIEGIIGGDGNDWLQGNAGDELLIGGTGDDTLIGFAGNDTLIGNSGIDWIGWDPTGGPDQASATAGDDIIYTNDQSSNTDGSADIINDVSGTNSYNYSPEEGDVLVSPVPV